jgi:ATP-dependent DNA ligase
MLARSGQLPTGGDYAYELKWDGFRAIVSTEGRRCGSRAMHLGTIAKDLRSRRLPMDYLGVRRW